MSSHIRGDDYCSERCELGKKQISVAPDGKLYPCVPMSGSCCPSRMHWRRICIGNDPPCLSRSNTTICFPCCHSRKTGCPIMIGRTTSPVPDGKSRHIKEIK